MERRGDLVIDRSELNFLLTFDEVDASRTQESRSRLGQQSTWDSVLTEVLNGIGALTKW